MTTSLLLLAPVIAALKSSVGTAVAGRFKAADDADWKRALAAALQDMQFKRPNTRAGTVQLHALQAAYPVPYPDFAALKVHMWADPARTPPPWEPGYPGAVPRVDAQFDGATWTLVFSPAPTMRQISAWGGEFAFWYFGRHVLSDVPGNSTLTDADQPLLLLRAQAELMREMAMQNVALPVTVRDGYSGTPRNGTPAALFEVLLAQFREAR